MASKNRDNSQHSIPPQSYYSGALCVSEVLEFRELGNLGRCALVLSEDDESYELVQKAERDKVDLVLLAFYQREDTLRPKVAVHRKSLLRIENEACELNGGRR